MNTVDFAGLSPAELPAMGQFLMGIDAATKALMVIDHNGVIAPAGSFVQKHTINFDDFAGLAQIETLSLGLVPPNAVFNGIRIHQKEDFVTNGISTALFRVGVVDTSDTIQYINGYTGTVSIKEFVISSLAGNNSGVASNDLSGIGTNIIFNTTSEQNLFLTIGVDAKNTAGNIVSLISSQAVVDFIVANGSILGGKYFTFATQANEYYVWYNTGSSTDPTPGGFSGAPTGIEIAINIADTAENVARKTQFGLRAEFEASLNLSSSVTTIRIGEISSGPTAYTHDVGTSGFIINTLTEGGVAPLKTTADLISGVLEVSIVWLITP